MDEVMPPSNIQEQPAFRLQPALELHTEETSSELTGVPTPPDDTEPAAMFTFCMSPRPPQPSHCSVHPRSNNKAAELSGACSAMQHRLQNQSYSCSSIHSSSRNAAAPPQSMLQAILAEVAASTPPPGPGTDANLYWNQVLQDHLRRRLQLHKQLRQQQQQPNTIQSVPGPLFEDPQFHHCMHLESTIPLLTNLSGTPVWPSASNDMDLDATTAFASAGAEDAESLLENSSGEGPMSSSTLKFPLTMANTGSCMGHHHSTNTPSFGANVLSTSSSHACRHSAQGADAFECDLTALLSSSIHSLGLHGISPSLSHSASSSPSPTTSPSSSPSPSPSITSASAPPTSQPTKPMTLSPLLPCPVPHCFRSFTRAFNLNAHLRTQHNLDPQDLGSQTPYSSSSIPSSPPAAAVSLTNGISPVPSAVISKASCSSSTSGTQQQQHQQPKPFPCHLCTRIFSRKHDLQRHIRVHTGSKPYLCMSCQKAFARTDALSRHYKVEDACRQMVLQLEADESSRRTQRGSVQQTLQSQAPLEQQYFYHHHHPQQQP